MKELIIRKETPHSHFYEEDGIDILDTNLTNLSIGAPGPDILKRCCELFKCATDHRMVSSKSSAMMDVDYKST